MKIYTGRAPKNPVEIVTHLPGLRMKEPGGSETFIVRKHIHSRSVRRIFGVSMRRWFFGLMIYSDPVDRRPTPPEDNRLALEKAEADIKALITLFETDAVFVGTGWAKFPDASAGTWPEVCVNITNYGADAEDIPRSEWQTVAALAEEFGRDAPEAWAAWRRGLDDTPKPSLGPKGKAALEALKARAALSHGEDDNGSL